MVQTQLCSVCLAEVMLGALRCRSCGAAFEGAAAQERLEVDVRRAHDPELGVDRVGLEFGLFPEDDVDG